MKIAVEGCCHGELDKIYETLEYIEKKNSIKIDLLLICGDFQAVRNVADLQCMAVPQHYQKLNTFYKYYSGEKKAPYLTVFIGGNHEASNYLQELPYGGWVAPNIYYMGYAGVIQVGGVRIGGLSGIFKGRDYNKGHFEHSPFNNETKRTVYHVRSFDVFRLKQISRPVDIFLSHDWPRGIYNFGNVNMLLKKKQYFREEVEQDRLGSPAAKELLFHIKPDYWFAAHLHVKFPAIVQHQSSDGNQKTTKFLSLDKCLPRRKFLQILDVPHDAEKPIKIELDPEWLVILRSTNHLMNLTKMARYMPGPGSSERWDFTVKKEEMNKILEDFGGDLSLPENFERTAPIHDPNQSKKKSGPPSLVINPQTSLLCTMLDLTDPNAVFLGKDSHIKPEDLSAMESASGESQAAEGEDEDDDVEDEEETEYESEPSFMSMSGSERSFLSSSNADESFFSENLNFSRDDQNASYNPDEISISDEEDEFKEIMAAQREAQKSDSSDEKLASPLKNVNIDSESSSLNTSLRSSEDEIASPIKSIVSEGSKLASPNKSLQDSYELDELDPEFLEMIAAQRKHQDLKSGGHIEIAASNSDDEVEEILKEQKLKKSKGIPESASPTEELLDNKASTDKSSQKRNEGTECEESPQTKRLKRRNQQLYTESDS